MSARATGRLMVGDDSLGIIALIPDNWDGIVTVRHHVLRRLAERYKVEWLEPTPNWREYLHPASDRFLAADRWLEPSPSLEVLITGSRHPSFHRPIWLAAASLRSRLSLARKRLLERGATKIALYLWRDEFADALDNVEHDFSCYHIDDEYTFSVEDVPNSAREVNLLRRVDQVIIHSRALFDKKGHVNPNTSLIPNGVDYTLFSTPHEEPPDMSHIPHPRIGYAGVIKKQLDFGLVVRLATARPDWSFVLVGPVRHVDGKEKEVATLKQMSNVYFLGGKRATELPAYIQHFDVCLLCYDVNDYTKYIYPLKLHEYLASGRPTVSSPIEAMHDFTHTVVVAKNDSEWLAGIDDGVNESRMIEADRLKAELSRRMVARDHDWDILVERIAELFVSAKAAVEKQHSEPQRAS